MEPIKSMKRRSMTASIIAAVVLIAIGAFAIFLRANLINCIFGAKDLNDTTENPSLSDGDYVKYTAYYALDYYASDSYGRYYIIPVGADSYMGVYVEGGDIDRYEALCDSTWDYLGGVTDYPAADPISIRGYVYKMSSVEKLYLSDWFKEAQYFGDESADRYITPYVLVPAGPLETFTAGDYIAAAVAILCPIIAILLIVLAATGFYQRRLVKALSERGYAEEQFSYEYTMAEQSGGVFVCNRWLMYGRMSPTVIFSDELLWIYKSIQTTIHKTYGIKTGETVSYFACFAKRDGRIITRGVKNEAAANELIELVGATFPFVATGYSDELQGLYSHNRDELARIVDDRRAGKATV